jgi:hypothetical protein
MPAEQSIQRSCTFSQGPLSCDAVIMMINDRLRDRTFPDGTPGAAGVNPQQQIDAEQWLVQPEKVSLFSLKQSCIAGSVSDHIFRVSKKERREL